MIGIKINLLLSAHEFTRPTFADPFSAVNLVANNCRLAKDFFSITRIEGYELPLSTTYAFFFNSEEPHGLGALFSEALLDVIHRKRPALRNRPILRLPIHAEREYPMQHGQRLDILVHDGTSARPIDSSATFALLIENKVGHWLANDLPNYWDSILPLSYKVGIVLGLRRESPVEPWLFVSHEELASAVEQRLATLPPSTDNWYFPLLQHFLASLHHMSNAAPPSFAQAFTFAQQHRLELSSAQALLKHLKPEWVANAIGAAFGEEYVQSGTLNDYPRVHIRRRDWQGIDYLIWFGNILDLTSSDPSYSITLWPHLLDSLSEAALRTHLEALFAASNTGIQRLSWFSDEAWFNEMIVGKDYTFKGSSLDDFSAEIAHALQTDWQPLELQWSLPVSSPSDSVL